MITSTNSFAPALSVGDGTLTVTVQPGTTYLEGVLTSFGTTNIVCAPNSTTFIYIDIGSRAITSNATGFPVNCYPIAQAVTLASVFSSLVDKRPDVGFNGLEYLGFGTTAAGSVTVPVALRDYVECRVRLRFYNPADIVAVQFNGDTGNNYVSRAVSMPTGGTTWTNDIDLTATNMIRLAPTAITGTRSISFWFGNTLNKEKMVVIHTASVSTNVSTGMPIQLGVGGWFNTTAQVNSITLLDVSGNSVGADIAIFGRNFN